MDASMAASAMKLVPQPSTVPFASISSEPLAIRLEVIGSIRIRRGGRLMEAIGGPKAGAHQALGLFAFLFDRDIRGMEKDEAIELIWPESPLPVADTAFHRTMLGLRRSLGGSNPDIIEFRAGRYFLSETLIASSDLTDLEDLLDASARENEPGARIALLERCRSLNRGAYLDDCPFYGTSVFVEVRRSLVHSVMTALLYELGDLYEASGHHALAAMRRGEVGLLSDGASSVRPDEAGGTGWSPLRRGRP